MLLSLNSNHKARVAATAFKNLKEFDILRPRRGCRAGRQIKSKVITTSPVRSHSSSSATSFYTLRQTSPDHVNLAVWNAQSICNKSTEFVQYVVDHGIDVVSITETWLRENDSSIITACKPDGYNFHSFPRSTGRGGGFAVVSNLPSVFNRLDQFQSFEACETVIKTVSKRFTLLTIYRPPPHPTLQFFSDILTLLEQYSLSSNLVNTGDFNIHIDDPSNIHTARLLDIIHSLNLTQLINSSTHKQGHTLDLVITNNPNLVKISLVHEYPLSDHFFLHVTLDARIPAPAKKFVTFRKFNNIDINILDRRIAHSLSNFSDDMDVNNAITQYNNTLTLLRDELAPLKYKTVSNHASPAWFTNNCRIAKQARHSRVSYLQSKIDGCGHDLRALFKLANKLLGRTTVANLPPSSSKLQLATDFNTFFVDKTKRLRQSISIKSEVSSFTAASHPSCHITNIESFETVSEDTVAKLLISMAPKSCDLDPFPTKIVRKLNCTVSLFRSLVNSSLSSGIFPDSLKIGIITPLLKKSTLDPHSFINYRPVTNIPFVAKIIEKVVCLILVKFLNSNNLFDSYQSDFRKAHSTESAVMKVNNDILQALDNGYCTLSVYLDLSAAFDTIDHSILIDRLSALGLSGTVLTWFNSYIKSRQQSVRVESAISVPGPVNFGVPQAMDLDLQCNDIQHMRNLNIPRCVKPTDFSIKTNQLHHFADASESGYEAVTYLRMTDVNDKIHCSILMSKSRLAPLKGMTIQLLLVELEIPLLESIGRIV
ncbi:uncharacterized protein LOC117108108 [Anneissia japonica]|uniref:uncharacterized protein LOC117108108 n=1 Tax=Anneissia japonica TaxID=1529436 RepID=UPI00142588B9|nr:uncharacterized protein LOC117108108 [Anneissia japonica]